MKNTLLVSVAMTALVVGMGDVDAQTGQSSGSEKPVARSGPTDTPAPTKPDAKSGDKGASAAEDTKPAPGSTTAKPADTKPASGDAASKPADTKPAPGSTTAKPADTKPATGDAATKPADAKPATGKAAAKPAEAKPAPG